MQRKNITRYYNSDLSNYLLVPKLLLGNAIAWKLCFVLLSLPKRELGKEGENGSLGRREKTGAWEGGRKRELGKEAESGSLGRRQKLEEKNGALF